jgi:hypothetical protein
MKQGIFCLCVLLACLMSCQSDDNSDTSERQTPACILAKIDSIKAEEVWSPPAKIFRYQYNGSLVYYITAHCCDIPSEVYDENCVYICGPDGGIAGPVDNFCLDFHSSKTDEFLVWEDDR